MSCFELADLINENNTEDKLIIYISGYENLLLNFNNFKLHFIYCIKNKNLLWSYIIILVNGHSCK